MIIPVVFFSLAAIEIGITSYLLVQVEENGGNPLSKEPVILPGKGSLAHHLEPKRPENLLGGTPTYKYPRMHDSQFNPSKNFVQSCCIEKGVSKIYLGLCMEPMSSATRNRPTTWENACSNFDEIVENCFLAAESRTDENISTLALGTILRVN